MRAKLFRPIPSRGLSLLGLAAVLAGGARADDSTTPNTSSATVAPWQQEDWLKPAGTAPSQAAPGETFHAATAPVSTDPYAVLSTGALWQDQYGEVYTRQMADALSLTCEASSVSADGASDLTRSQKIGFQFQPIEAFTFRGDFHDALNDPLVAADSTTTNGTSLSAEGHLPGQTVLTLGMQTDHTSSNVLPDNVSQTNAYDAQIQQPLGQLPLSAQLKGHFEGTSTNNGSATNLPSIEQSLVWKPLQSTTLQAGLRQQHYQEYPGVDNELNEALFADWSQKVVDNISWHSYAEVLNSKGMLDQAPAAPIASGANGTPQATTPNSNAGLTSSLPVSVDDQTVTFTTGPSVQLQKDLSASVEYSNRWDKNAATPGNASQEHRVSVSLKGTF